MASSVRGQSLLIVIDKLSFEQGRQTYTVRVSLPSLLRKPTHPLNLRAGFIPQAPLQSAEWMEYFIITILWSHFTSQIVAIYLLLLPLSVQDLPNLVRDFDRTNIPPITHVMKPIK